MDKSPADKKPSGIPRASRLPVPRATLRPSQSRESLQQSRTGGISNPRLRNAPSREQINSSVPRRLSTTPLRSQGSLQQLRSQESTITGSRQLTRNALPRRESDRLASNEALKNPTEGPSTQAQEKLEHEDFEGDHSGLGPLLSANNEGVRDEIEGYTVDQTPKKSRPSLSERAMDTLKSIPPSPAVRRRTSSFFNPESPMRPPSSGNHFSRPGSSHEGSMRPPSRGFNSRPGSRSGPGQSQSIDFRASTNTVKPPHLSFNAKSIPKQPSLSNLRTPSSSRISAAQHPLTKLPSPGLKLQRTRSPSPGQTPKTSIKFGSKTVAVRPLKPRPSMNGLFRKPSTSNLQLDGEIDRLGFGPKKQATVSNTSSDATSTTSKASRATIATSASSDVQETTPRKSSLALREQIAKAKAAKRAAAAKTEESVAAEVPVIPADSFDFGLADDPFNQRASEKGSRGLLKKRIQSARNDGRLNIAAMGLKHIPDEVLTMYDIEANDGSWAECVDLTRFVAAGNEIEIISDNVFPDFGPRDVTDDEETKGNQFGGLETLDLHGNLLIALPLGLRRLELLTTLNISNNKLDNECLEVISQVPSIRDLKLGNNGLSGTLDASIMHLANLESLDLQHNALTSLPDSLSELLRLRLLNLNGNQLTTFTFTNIRSAPLTELLLAKNKLTGTLIGSDIEILPQLQVLDITANAVTSLSASKNLKLPVLHQLRISSNRLTSIPDISSWTSLRVLTAEDNNIDSIPEGLTTLQNLTNVDFSGNNIRVLEDQIGNMENLDIFRISGNPLRDKKFSGMTTEDLKRTLKARIEPTEQEKETDQEGSFYSASTSPISPNRPHSSDWPVLPGGVLDRSNQKSHSLNPVAAANTAAMHQIKALELHHNVYTEIPSSIGFFALTLTTLNLSHNELSSDSFFKDELDLPVLKELNLSSNTFNSLQPLMQKLQAPNMVRLDISFNRLTSLPPLRPHFPALITLLASNNTIHELSPEAVKGLTTLDCSSNEINSLNARIGLLGGPGGLQRLDVSGNRFRVPKYTVLEKGTEATLAWLRDRIPTVEMGNGE